MIDRIFTRVSVGVGLLFIVVELTFINSRSLAVLTHTEGAFSMLFAVIGALAFSMVTVIIMRKGTEKWLKIAFPIFDAVLMFLGLNMEYAETYRFALTIFMSLFAGLITYSLGKINYQDHTVDESTLTHPKNSVIQNVSSEEYSAICLNSLKQEALLYIKKSPSNLSEYESRIIDMYHRIKGGVSFSYEEYLMLRNE